MAAKLLPSDMNSPKRNVESIRSRSVAADADARMSDPHAQDRLKPASGLLLGLALGAAIWIGLLIFAWEFFHKAH